MEIIPGPNGSAYNGVYAGDAVALTRSLPDNSIDFVFTDPPYGHNNNDGDLISRWEAALGRGDYIADRDNRPIANDGQEANELFREIVPEFYRVLKPGCCCCCCCCGGGGPDPQFAKWSLWLNDVFHGGFKQMVVWDKGPMGMGWHYRRSYEAVLVAQKTGAACKWYDITKRVENIIRPGQYGIRKIIPSACQHPTTKPHQLAAFFIRLHTEKDDVVLDPFVGEGSTLVATAILQRRWIGFDIDEGYVTTARHRASSATPTLFDKTHRVIQAGLDL